MKGFRVVCILAVFAAPVFAQQGKVDPLGVTFVESRQEARIAQVFPDSPAAKRGFQSGDLITEMNDLPIDADYVAVIVLDMLWWGGNDLAVSVQSGTDGRVSKVSIPREELERWVASADSSSDDDELDALQLKLDTLSDELTSIERAADATQKLLDQPALSDGFQACLAAETDDASCAKQYCDLGSKQACFTLTDYLWKRSGILSPAENAPVHFESCRLGYGQACYYAAEILKSGKDLVRAREYYQLACYADYRAADVACIKLGNMLYRGTGGPQDRESATPHFMHACKLNGEHDHCR